MTTGAPRLADNPFYVLGLAVEASRIEVEREAQKLLGMLELGFAAAASYATPLGPRVRTTEMVRAAVAALRDPYRRLVAELWARHAPPVTPLGQPGAPGETADVPAPSAASRAAAAGGAHPGLRRALGWRP